MRTSDAKKVLHSYTTVWDGRLKEWVVRRVTWLPGYTSMHKATPEEALQVRIDLLHLEMQQTQDQIGRLNLALAHLDDKTKENN